MGFCGRGFYSSILLCAAVFSFALAVEAQQPASSAALNEQQARGKALFNQNCRLCHTPRPVGAKNPELEDNIGPNLAGVFDPPRSRPEAVVRTFIQQGISGLMPGFRYGLDAEEIDAIIAYMRTL